MAGFGTTPPIVIPITASDQTSAAFASAKAGAISAKAHIEGFGAAAGPSLMVAREAVRGFGEEIGIRVPRFIATALVNVQEFAAVAASAFGVIAVAGLAEFFVTQVIPAIQNAASALGGYTRALREADAAAAKSNIEQLSHFKTLAEGYRNLGTIQDVMRTNQQAIDDTSASWSKWMQDIEKSRLGIIGPAFAFIEGSIRTIKEAILDSDDATKKYNEDLKVQLEIIKKIGDEALKAAQEESRIEKKATEEAEKAWKDQEEKWKREDEAAKRATAARLQLEETLAAAAKSVGVGFGGQYVKMIGAQISALDKLFKEFPYQAQFPALGTMGVAQGLMGGIPGLPLEAQEKSKPTPLVMPVYTGTKEAMEQAKIVSDLTARWDAYREIVEEARTPTEAFNEAIANLNNVFMHTDLTVEQYNLALQHIKNSLDPNTIAMREFAEEAGRMLNAALLFGRSWSDALKSIIALLIQTILKVTILRNLQESGKGGGILGTFLSGLAGGGLFHAYGGEVSANVPIVVGEKGPELWVPPAAGRIIPNDQLKAGVTNNYYVDNRGATMESMLELRRIIKQSHDSAVIQSVYLTKELDRRT